MASRRHARPARAPRPQAVRQPPARGVSTWIAALAIVVAGLAAYANSFSGVFVLDDKNAIVLNPAVRTLWPLTTAMNAPRDTTLAGRPVASLSFALTYALAPADARDVFTASPTDASAVDRLQKNLWTYHAVNVVIHLLAALTLFGVVRRTLLTRIAGPKGPPYDSTATALALLVALLWVVHPITTSAVTYIVQRVESLMALFYLLTLYCAIRGWTFAAIAACALAMGTKEAAVSAPLVVVAWDFLMLTEPWGDLLARRWRLYAGLAATWLLLAAIVSFSPRSASVGFGLHGVTSWAYLMTQAGVIVHYLRLAFVPWPLSLDYEWPIAASFTAAILPGIVVLALLVLTVWGLARRAAWSFAGVWFFLILAPTSSVVPIVTEVAADHRMYLPVAAIIAVVIIGARSAGLSGPRSAALKGPPYVIHAVAVTLVVVLATMTHARNADYSSEEGIYRATVAARPSNARARSNLASVLIERGRTSEAEALLHEAVRLKPDYADAYANLGVAYVVQGRYQEALAPFEKAVALAPASPTVWRNYAETLGSVGRFADAAGAFRKALASSPDDPDALEGLAWILATAPDAGVRDGKSAVALAQHVAELSGDRAPNVLDTLGAAYAENGQFAEAIAAAQRALTLARAAGPPDLIPQIEGRLELYRARQPYREPVR